MFGMGVWDICAWRGTVRNCLATYLPDSTILDDLM